MYSALAGACKKSITQWRYRSKLDYLFAEEDERGERGMRAREEKNQQDDMEQSIREINEARNQCHQAGILAVTALIISGLALIIRLL